MSVSNDAIVRSLRENLGGFSILNDIIIKKVLGEPGDAEERLKSFLNAIWKHLKKPLITAVEILHGDNFPDNPVDKITHLDIKARDEQGKMYNIEIQLSYHKYFLSRIVYYGAQLHASQLSRGEDYENIHPTICIVLTDFILFPESDKVFRSFGLKSLDEPMEALSDDLQFYFIQFPNLTSERLQSLDKDLAEWTQFLNFPRTSEKELIGIMNDNSVISQTGAMLSDFVTSNREYLEAVERDRRDRVAIFETGIDKGYAKGMEKGIEEGIEKGIEEGIEKGIEKGELSGKRKMLFKLLNRNIPGQMPQSIINRINAIENPEIIEELALDSLDIRTYEEFTKLLDGKAL